ncbi:DUF2975 domain-containing protein [Clostridium ganghwense]|uniref:DUF2975 domain-containing protein n=1 Tax=Clostridium ganghwense TaxID=312089 RepID=A0ABT4CQ76_9CLOT|nr:DUF2975 domain-containing protein [Clostridium ganghwense]MCY6371103.1 DUF2975 domain-containing protein [Clostridium ganghwense]
MKYYGNHSLADFLKIMLDILLLIGIGMFIFISKNALSSDALQISTSRKVFICSLFLIGSISLILIVYNLRKIVKSLIIVNPFVRENVRSLRNISIECFTVATCYLLNFFMNPKYGEFHLIAIDARGVHTDMEFFIFFFAGCFILILSKVFQQAVETKEENDFTI